MNRSFFFFFLLVGESEFAEKLKFAAENLKFDIFSHKQLRPQMNYFGFLGYAIF